MTDRKASIAVIVGDFPLTIGHVRIARALLGWTKAEFARRAGIGRMTFDDFESGRRVPTPRTTERIVSTLTEAGIEFLHRGVQLREGVPWPKPLGFDGVRMSNDLPIQGPVPLQIPDAPRSVPLAFVRQFERRALLNHGQTIDHLAKRGGLSYRELAALIEDMDLGYAASITNWRGAEVVVQALKEWESQNG